MEQSDKYSAVDIAELDDCGDDYRYDSNYDLYDSLDCEDPRYLTDRPSRFVERHILPGLYPMIEELRTANKDAKIGAVIKCPMCGKIFTKKSYQQKFCSNGCKVKYHNKRQVWY